MVFIFSDSAVSEKFYSLKENILNMRITRILERTIPLTTNISNSARSLKDIRTTIVAVVSDVIRNGKPLIGFAFSSIGRASHGTPIRERIAPRVLDSSPDSMLDASGTNFCPAKIHAVAMHNEKLGGDAERSAAIGTLDIAVWDLVAKIEEKPLHQVLAERFNSGKVEKSVFCYVGGGWYRPGQTTQDLQDEMRGHLDAGYSMLKMKVGGLTLDEDCKRIEAVLKIVGNSKFLAVDANCIFDRQQAIDCAKAIAQFGLRWYEEPCHPLDFESYKAVSEVYEPPLAACENLFSPRELENFLLYSGFRSDKDIVQIDPPLAYGISGYLSVIEIAQKHGFNRKSLFPHGGNLMGLHIAAGFGLGGCESYPGVFGAAGGFNDEVILKNGYAILPKSPGLGFEAKPELFPIMQEMIS